MLLLYKSSVLVSPFKHFGNVCHYTMVRWLRVVETITFKMATAQIVLVIEVMYFFEIFASGNSSGNVSTIPCPYLRNSPPLNVQDLVGSWLTVYTQPKAIDCFTLHIRATTDLVSIFLHTWRLRYTYPRYYYDVEMFRHLDDDDDVKIKALYR